MTDQLNLFSQPRRMPPTLVRDPVGGFVPMAILPNDPSYKPFDGAEVKRIALELCANSGSEWVHCFRIFKKTRMYPSDVSRLLRRMVDTGQIEQTRLYLGSDDVRSKDYHGFQHGYRLPQRQEPNDE